MTANYISNASVLTYLLFPKNQKPKKPAKKLQAHVKTNEITLFSLLVFKISVVFIVNSFRNKFLFYV